MPHHPNVVVVDISSAMMVSRRVPGFANRSTSVNRASCREASSRCSPRFCAAVTSRRLRSDSVHLSDSIRPRRIQDQRSFPADVVGQNPTRDSTKSPSKQRDCNRQTRVKRNRRAALERKELLKGNTGGEYQRVRLVTIEHPAQISDEQRIPLPPVERAIPVRNSNIGFFNEPRIQQGHSNLLPRMPF